MPAAGLRSFMRASRTIRRVLLTCLSCGLLVSCTVGGSSSASAENDRLRREVHDLRATVRMLEADNAELSAKLAPSSPLTGESLQALPILSSIEIGSLTHWMPTDRSMAARGIMVYVRPLDGHGRFVQAVGTLRVRATTLEGDEIASVMFTPMPLREAYRSGFTGTHYAVELPLAAPMERVPAIITATLTDSASGRVHTAARTITPP